MRLRSCCALLPAVLAALSLGWSAAVGAEPAARPNILWITCEDISPVLGCYGDEFAVTPNLDRLAADGIRYTRAFATASVCSPARSSLITGVFASTLGTQHLRTTIELPKEIHCFPEFLREAGYYCTNNVKQDYQFRAPPDTWDESSRTAHWRNRKAGQPFFAVFNITTTHQGQIRLGDQQFAQRTARLTPDERHDPARVPLPPYYPDSPVVRRDVARLYDLVTAMDKQAGDLLRQLDEDGLADETIVFFYSDHGTGLPRGKRWLHDSGIRVPLILRFPEKYRYLAPGPPGTVTDRLVSFVDFAPSVLSLLGLEIPAYMQGTAFLGPQAGKPRTEVFAIRDRVDEVYELSRCVREKRFHYIRNYFPQRPRMQKSVYSEQTPTRGELRRLAAAGKLEGTEAWLVQPDKPLEELYDAENDPHMVHNLAGSPEHEAVLRDLRARLDRWTLGTRDTGYLPQAEMHRRAGDTSILAMARDPQRYPLERIRAAADLVGRGVAMRDRMAACLQDPDPAVRHWGAVALGTLGEDAAPAVPALERALDDPSPIVRIAAAEALCHAGRPDAAVAVLESELEGADVWTPLHAAIALQYVGPDARPALPTVRQVMAAPPKTQAGLYIKWALVHVLENVKE